MNLFTIIIKHLFHSKSRTLFTILGVGVSIAAFVALSGLASNMEEMLRTTYKSRGTDLIVIEKEAADILSSNVNQDYLKEIKALPMVEDVSALTLDFANIGIKQYLLVYGWQLKSFLFDELKVKGQLPTKSDEAIIGSMAAKRLKKNIGDELKLKGDKLKIVGIFSSKSVFEEGAVIVLLDKMQELKKNQNKVSMFNVKLKKNNTGKINKQDLEEQFLAASNQINTMFPDVEVKNVEDFVANNTPLSTLLNFTWAISVVACIIAILGITNTMITSVMERIKEIGILRAIGWRNSRIFSLVLYEAVFLSFIGGIFGIGLGYVLTKILIYSPYLQGVIRVNYDLNVISKSIISSLFLGFFAGLYPAIKAISINPIEVLRNEH